MWRGLGFVIPFLIVGYVSTKHISASYMYIKNELYKTASASNIVQTILVTDRGHNDNTVTTVFVVVVFTIKKSTEL